MIIRTSLTFLFVWFIAGLGISQKPIDYVDLFICTSGDYGQLDPAATVPYGMVKLGPDTDPGNHSGYNYKATKVKGFSHNRIGGVGCRGAGGNLRILPGIGEASSKAVPFKKDSEKAVPGYYAMTFENGIQAELTSTNQTGFHRYTFPASENAFISADFSSSFAGTISASKSVLNENEFTVEVSAKNVCMFGRYTVYYHIWSSKPIAGGKEKDGVFHFPFKTSENEQVTLMVTASSISAEDARKEWKSKTRKLKFEAVAAKAKEEWSNILSKIIVEGKEEYKTIFYTHLYHLFLNPVKSENRSGKFRATDGKLYKSKGYVHYDTWSMWDNFRNKFSLYSIIQPEVSSDICNSLVDLFKYGKPYWSGFYEPTPTVRTEHTVVALLDFYRRGVNKFDIEPVYQKLIVEIDNISEKSPDTKLEKSYDYWALSEFAGILGKKADQSLFLDQSHLYKKTWKKYFLKLDKEADIMHAKGLYEGTVWQYRWHVQFDVPGLIELFGGKAKYTENLEYFFDNDLYNHGNQPDIHVPYMFNFSDKPYLTQKWVNKILTKNMVQRYGTHKKWKKPYKGRIYKNSPEGYIPEMDDDEGTMSGWYVLSAMGIYPVLVGDPVFQLSTPIFDKITIKLPENKEFVIKTKGFSDESFYVESATLNGKDYSKGYIDHKDIMAGGVFEIKTSKEPNKKWGLAK